MITDRVVVEPGQVWLDTTARIDGNKPGPTMRRVERVERVDGSGLGYVDTIGWWERTLDDGRHWHSLVVKRKAIVQLAHWHRRMRLIGNADGSEA